MKKLFFLFLGILILGLSGCNRNKGDEIVYYHDIPAVLGYDYSLNQAVLFTPGKTYLAPEMGDYLYYGYLAEGDVLMTYFYLNLTRQPSKDFQTVTNIDWTIVDSASPIEESNSAINEIVPVDSMFCYAFVHHDKINFLYAGFYHKDTYYRTFDYEMTYDDNETNAIPTLSIRAKNKGDASKTKASFWWVYAFDMDEYIENKLVVNPVDSTVKVNFRFMSKDSDGNDIWKELQDSKGKSLNPITITLK